MILGTEWCPHCMGEFDFCVHEDEWWQACPHCGARLLLCDKCRTMNGEISCGECPYENEREKT